MSLIKYSKIIFNPFLSFSLSANSWFLSVSVENHKRFQSCPFYHLQGHSYRHRNFRGRFTGRGEVYPREPLVVLLIPGYH